MRDCSAVAVVEVVAEVDVDERPPTVVVDAVGWRNGIAWRIADAEEPVGPFRGFPVAVEAPSGG